MGEGRVSKLIVNRSIFLFVILHFVLSFAFFPAQSIAASVALQWDPSTDADLAGYKVYYQANSLALPFAGSGAAEGGAPIDVKDVTTTTISGLDPSNSYYFAVTAYNSAGIESAYSNVIEVAESVPPSVTVAAPSDGGSVSGTVTVSASASDNVGVTVVRFYVNGEVVAERGAQPYSFEWNTAPLPPGAYTITAKAYDAAQNEGSSSAVVVTVAGDTTGPVVSVAAPRAAPVAGMVAVSASATDDSGVSSLELSLDGSALLTGNQSAVTYTLDTATVANGSHTLCARAYDAAGNPGEACVTIVVNNPSADATPPVVSAFSMPASADGFEVPVEAFAAADGLGVTGYLITESATAPTADAPGWSPSAPGSFHFSGAGNRTAYAWAKDAAGNVSAARSAAVAITLPDTTAPVAGISVAGEGVVGGTVTVTATGTDDLAVTELTLFFDGKAYARSSTGSISVQWDSAAVANGSHTFTAVAYDAAGNASAADSVTVSVFNDKTSPSLTIDPVGTVSLSTVTISGTVSDDGTVAGVMVQVGSSAAAAARISGTTWSYTATGLAAGSHLVAVRATDGAGNVATATTTVAVQGLPSPGAAELTIDDALTVLYASLGDVVLTDAQMARFDVAPYVNGVSQPDGKIDVGDAVVIVRAIVGKR